MKKRRADYIWNVWVKTIGVPSAVVSTAAQALARDFSVSGLLTRRVLLQLVISVICAVPVSYLVGRLMWHWGFGQESL
jgi:hypothetical protein